jgi:DNA-binding protein YbaB
LFDALLEDAGNRRTDGDIVGSAGGGAVTVRLADDFGVAAVSVDEALLADRELLEELVAAATNDALEQAEARARSAALDLLTSLSPSP